MAEDINGFIRSAQNYCWDETHGYRIGGNMNPDTDCSGLIWQALHDNGFNVGSYRFDTSNMMSILSGAGFSETIYTNVFVPQHGDIFVYNEFNPDQTYDGHAFIYAENVNGYVNGSNGWEYCDGTTGRCATAKIEASGKHNHPENGDQDNGHGAHTEVWVHTYGTLCDPAHTWHVFRWGTPPTPPAPTPGEYFNYLFYKKIKEIQFKFGQLFN